VPNLGEVSGKQSQIRSKDAAADGAEPLRNAADKTTPPGGTPWLTFFAAWALLSLAPDARACSSRPQAHHAHARAHKPASRPLLFCAC